MAVLWPTPLPAGYLMVGYNSVPRIIRPACAPLPQALPTRTRTKRIFDFIWGIEVNSHNHVAQRRIPNQQQHFADRPCPWPGEFDQEGFHKTDKMPSKSGHRCERTRIFCCCCAGANPT